MSKENEHSFVLIYSNDTFDVYYDKDAKRYHIDVFDDGHYWDEVWFDAYKAIDAHKEKEAANKAELIEWLLGEKYNIVNENNDNMTEEFEKQHQWELSRNCFINKIIKYIEQMT